MPSNIEAEISRVLHAHLKAGAEPELEKIDTFMQFIADTFTGIGHRPARIHAEP